MGLKCFIIAFLWLRQTSSECFENLIKRLTNVKVFINVNSIFILNINYGIIGNI